ncbi:hypothetical protein H5410_044103 [Solanum commersonii]|uniref:Uncharacterized protein n=1 Tax=Solanum commersonii TaxID=4109 RepID=A0A9J5Y070_SOLCO|nr:hypothetical protein H5410_044103 [Solanum commersonii]
MEEIAHSTLSQRTNRASSSNTSFTVPPTSPDPQLWEQCNDTVKQSCHDDCYRLIGFPEDFNFTNDKTYSTP